MSNKPFEQGRRRVLRLALGGVAAIPFGSALLRDTAQAAEKVSPDDSMAKTLKYTESSTKKGQTCSNCQFIQGKGEYAPCTVFQGKLVAAQGWCSSWAPPA